MDQVCCISTNDLLENEQHNSFNKTKRTYSELSIHSSRNLKYINPMHNNLPSNEIKFNLHYQKKITSLSHLPIGMKNIIRQYKGNPYQNYEIIKNLGGGSFGNIFMAEHKITGNIRSIKVIPKDNLKLGFTEFDIIQEIDIFKSLEHPNCIKLYEFYIDDNNYYLINEYCSDGDLNEKLHALNNFPESITKILMFQIFSGVAYLHSKKIIHGDLKLENILVDSILEENKRKKKNKRKKSFISCIKENKIEISKNITKIKTKYAERRRNSGFSINKSFTYDEIPNNLSHINIRNSDIKNFELKFIDFGCSKIFNKYKRNFEDTIGTLLYCAPEVLLNDYNEKCDIWSCGVILYVLLSGTYPFNGKNEQEITKKILNGNFEFNSPLFDDVSSEAKDLIKKCLTYDRNERISAINALKHPFFINEINPHNLFSEDIHTKNILFSIQNFSKHNKFYQVVLAFLSHNFAEKTHLDKLKKVFLKMDLNFDGKISKEELYYAYKNEGINIENDELDKIIESIDLDNNGYIEYEEFIRTIIPRESLFTNSNLKAAFDFFDLDKNGFISFNEVQEVLGLRKDVDINVINELKREIEKNGDEDISFEEFKAIMISFAQEDMFNFVMRRNISDDEFGYKDFFNSDSNSLISSDYSV